MYNHVPEKEAKRVVRERGWGGNFIFFNFLKTKKSENTEVNGKNVQLYQMTDYR